LSFVFDALNKVANFVALVIQPEFKKGVKHTLETSVETILEEDSVIKKATPQKKTKHASPKRIKKSRSVSCERKVHSNKPPTKPVQAQSAWPELSDAERKVAEADVYLKRLNDKEKEKNHVKFRESVYTREMEK
jgi:hypothetical protein